MKTSSKAFIAAGVLALIGTPLWAAETVREDNSNLLVWAFLGICALIIFLQMVPVISLAYGLMKGIFGKEDDLEVAASKYR